MPHMPPQGSGASPEGNKPFLDILEVDTGATQRIWQSKPPFYESTGAHPKEFEAYTLDLLHLAHVHHPFVRAYGRPSINTAPSFSKAET